MPIKIIRIRKAGGGTRLQKVEVLKSGKYKFVKNNKKTRKFTTRKRRTTRRGDETLSGRKAYPRVLRKSTLSNLARKRRKSESTWNF